MAVHVLDGTIEHAMHLARHPSSFTLPAALCRDDASLLLRWMAISESAARPSQLGFLRFVGPAAEGYVVCALPCHALQSCRHARSMAEDCHAPMPLTCFRLRPPNGLHRSIQFDSERTLKDSGKEDMTSCRDRQPLLGTGHQVPLISRDPMFSERFHA